jgi:glucose-1-phosphate cytidylyltransferase
VTGGIKIKTIILAGGLGTRISEETGTKPKPMVLIDDKPILWHVMNIYAQQGFKDFIIATGYKHEVIDAWVQSLIEPWTVQTVFTGYETQTGGRIKQCVEMSPADLYFITYGDGLANVSLRKLLALHNQMNRIVTVTAVRPPARFGVLEIQRNVVQHFGEKLQADSGWINGGFFVSSPDIVNFIQGDHVLFETGPLPHLATRGELAAYQHEGFWQPMDTLREKVILEEFVRSGTYPWLDISH